MKFDKDFDLEPSEYRREDQPAKRFDPLDFISSLIAAAILLPIAWWLKQHHFIADWLRATFG